MMAFVRRAVRRSTCDGSHHHARSLIAFSFAQAKRQFRMPRRFPRRREVSGGRARTPHVRTSSPRATSRDWRQALIAFSFARTKRQFRMGRSAAKSDRADRLVSRSRSVVACGTAPRARARASCTRRFRARRRWWISTTTTTTTTTSARCAR